MRRFPLLPILAAGLVLPSSLLAADTAKRCETVLVEVLELHETAFWPAMHAAEGLADSGRGAMVLARLAPLLEAETDTQKRCGLARELARAGDRTQAGLLLDLLLAEDDHAHVHAAESLFKLRWNEDLALPRRILAESPNERLRVMVAALLAGHDDPAGLAHLRGGMEKEEEPALIFLFAWALGQVGAERDKDLIRSRLPDMEDDWQRAFLVHALARLNDPEARRLTLENLASPDPRIRAYAAETCGAIRLTAAAEPLAKLLGDEDPDARVRAAHALLLLEQKGS
jgi:sialidase-1